MLNAIVAELKKGSIKNVVPFPYDKLPAAPYVVVREGSDPITGFRRYTISTHYAAMGQVQQKVYTVKELSQLLNGFKGTTANGNTHELMPVRDSKTRGVWLSDFYMDPGDKTSVLDRAWDTAGIIF